MLIAQPGIVFGSAQGLLQPPQSLGLLWVWVSHPFAAFPSQLPKLASHGPSAHAPPTHAGAAFAKPAQALAQEPQWAASVAFADSHPSLGSASQSWKPAE